MSKLARTANPAASAPFSSTAKAGLSAAPNVVSDAPAGPATPSKVLDEVEIPETSPSNIIAERTGIAFKAAGAFEVDGHVGRSGLTPIAVLISVSVARTCPKSPSISMYPAVPDEYPVPLILGLNKTFIPQRKSPAIVISA